jgi:hypothetical protein
MATTYTIYLVNQSATTQEFWCFLARPPELMGNPGVYANSSVALAIPPNDPATNSITVPVQYVVGDGASNEAVGLNVQIESDLIQYADMTQVWQASYVTAPPNMGPSLSLSSGTTGPNSIAIASNAFDQANNEANGWFSNMSYGIETAQGFMGMTWSPSPNQMWTLTPNLSFYVTTGYFGSNMLADWASVSNNAAEFSAPADFSMSACTATYTSNGEWSVTPGAPA